MQSHACMYVRLAHLSRGWVGWETTGPGDGVEEVLHETVTDSRGRQPGIGLLLRLQRKVAERRMKRSQLPLLLLLHERRRLPLLHRGGGEWRL